MNLTRAFRFFSVVALAVLVGCAEMQTTVYQEDAVTETGEPAYITIQHCLVGVRDGLETTNRTLEDADVLAADLLAKAKAGEDFDAIVRKHTDDSPPGIYMMANNGFPGDRSSRISSRWVHSRAGMVPGFGDVGFKLEVGEIGMASYDPIASPYGFHIIKRLT